MILPDDEHADARWFALREGTAMSHTVNAGRHTYFGRDFHIDKHGPDELTVTFGAFCSVAPEVTILLDGEHRTDVPSTFPFLQRLACGSETIVSKGPVVVGNDVWIGQRATILSGVTIGDGAVIGACACVTHDVDPYTIVGGVPARVIGHRTDPGVAWWEWTDEEIRGNAHWLTTGQRQG